MGRNADVPDELIKQRIQYAVSLKLAGYSALTILQKINADASTKGWGEIKMRQLKYDFSFYYSCTMVTSAEEMTYLKFLQASHMQELEVIIEQQQVRIDTRTDWKPFEYERALRQLFDMKVKYMNFLAETAAPEHQNAQGGIADQLDRVTKAMEQISESGREGVREMLIQPIKAMRDSTDGKTDPRANALLLKYYRDLWKLKKDMIDEGSSEMGL